MPKSFLRHLSNVDVKSSCRICYIPIFLSLTQRKISSSFPKILNRVVENKTKAESKSLTWYSCGPTVYDQAHIGHARTYVCSDVIRRILQDYFNVHVNYAMGVTDIDDKIINKGKELGLFDWTQIQPITRQLEEDFFDDLDRLNVLRPNAVLRITEHIPEILDYIKKLESLGYTYTIPNDGVYFSVSLIDNRYDKLCPVPPSNVETENISHKRNWRDFALWKFSPIQTSTKSNQSDDVVNYQNEPGWESPWGRGRPGWHIECSAVTNTYFGKYLDMHSGGVDLKFPHHTNEIAQSEAYNELNKSGNRDWVSQWIHTGHLYIEGRKMSKSLKNFISIKEYLNNYSCDIVNINGNNITEVNTNKNIHNSDNPADDFRIFCLQHKYDSNIHFNKDKIADATIYREKIIYFLRLYQSIISVSKNIHMKQISGTSSSRSINKNIVDDYNNNININYEIKKPTKRSNELQELLINTQQIVHEALCNDFDTPKVLRTLSVLIDITISYMSDILLTQSKQQGNYDHIGPIDVVISINTYLSKILCCFGLENLIKLQHKFSQEHHQNNTSHESTTSANNIYASETLQLIDLIVQFRSTIRTSSLEGLKRSKSITKQLHQKSLNQDKLIQSENSSNQTNELVLEFQKTLKNILQICDTLRDQDLPLYGVLVDDKSIVAPSPPTTTTHTTANNTANNNTTTKLTDINENDKQNIKVIKGTQRGWKLIPKPTKQ